MVRERNTQMSKEHSPAFYHSDQLFRTSFYCQYETVIMKKKQSSNSETDSYACEVVKQSSNRDSFSLLYNLLLEINAKQLNCFYKSTALSPEHVKRSWPFHYKSINMRYMVLISIFYSYRLLQRIIFGSFHLLI